MERGEWLMMLWRRKVPVEQDIYGREGAGEVRVRMGLVICVRATVIESTYGDSDPQRKGGVRVKLVRGSEEGFG
jgi:hypothetical protein